MKVKPVSKLRFTNQRDVAPPRPIVHGGCCYFETGADRSEFKCLRLGDGSEVWRKPAPKEAFLPFAMAGDVLLFGAANRIKALTLQGEELWTTDGQIGTWNVWRDRVVLAGSGLRILSAKTGLVVESIPLPGIPSGVMVRGDMFIGFSKDHRRDLACDLQRKSVLWHRDLGVLMETQAFSPRRPDRSRNSDEDVFVATSGSSLFGFSVSSGDLLWQYPARPEGWPIVSRDRVDFWRWDASDSTTHLVCLDPLSGSTRYDRTLNAYGKVFSAFHETNALAVHPAAIVVSSRQGLLAAFSPTDGELLWHYKHSHPLDTRPAIDQDKVVVGTGDGCILIFPVTAPG